jgi:hypothetical protein
MTTGNTFYDKLTAIQAKCKAVLEGSADPSTQPTALLMLAETNSIIQAQQMVALMTVVVQELQANKTAASQWRDAKGIFYLCALEGTTIRTYRPNGDAFVPTEPSTPVIGSSGFTTATLESSAKVIATPSHIRMLGMEHMTIPAGATSIEITVKSGEVSSSNGTGALVPGDNFKWDNYDGGLSKIDFVGATPDTEYAIAILRPEVPLPKPLDPALVKAAPSDHPLTAELIPHPLVMAQPPMPQLPQTLPAIPNPVPVTAPATAIIA